MCQAVNVNASDSPVEDAIMLSAEQLEELIEQLVPSGANLVSGLSGASDPAASLLWEKCTRCVKGFKVCIKCSWTGCKVRVRRC